MLVHLYGQYEFMPSRFLFLVASLRSGSNTLPWRRSLLAMSMPPGRIDAAAQCFSCPREFD